MNNEHYANINRRFEGRAAQLFKLGFRYEQAEGYGIAVWVKDRYGKRLCIPAATVLYADDIVWGDQLERASREAE